MMANHHVSRDTQRVAIVTGGSRGLGRSMVLHLADRGVSSIFTYARAKDEAEKVVSLVKDRGARAIAIQSDVSDTSKLSLFVDRVRQALDDLDTKRFHYLVNNAGTSHEALITETTEADFDAIYRVHLKGVFFLTQRLLPFIADGGHIINISSGLARFAFPQYAAYACMKGAVEVLTRYLAKELGQRKICVNTVAPGAVETDFRGGSLRDSKEENAGVAAITAFGRAGLPDDIGGMVASLLTGDNHWVTAQRIEVSGGTLI